MASLELNLFGGFAARLGTGESLRLPGRKTQLLLAFLALRAGEPQTREKLIGLLWSDRGDMQARGSLRQELTALRKLLGGVKPPPLTVDGERLCLDAEAVGVDVRHFDRLIQSDATPDLERAVELYRGPLLEGLAVRDPASEEWLQHERERLRLLLLGVLDRLLARQTKAGALERATATAESILAQDPLREDAHRALMELHAAQGRHSLALKQYQICRETLARELQVEPEPETERLLEQIQARRTTAPAERSMIAVPAVGSGADASQFYLMGRSYFLRNIWARGALQIARQLFEQAIAVEPTYARAYAGLVDCDCYRLLLGEPGVSLETIEANSARALELDPGLAEAHAAKGLALYTIGDYAAADASFERAVTLGPELFEAHYFYARNCRSRGDHLRAARLFERAASLNRNDFRALGLLADEYRVLGRFDDSLAASRRCLERIKVEVAAQPDDSHALSFGAAVRAELGEHEGALEWAARAAAAAPEDPVVNYNLACAYAALGRADAAVDRLRAVFGTAMVNRRAFRDWVQHDSALDQLRENVRFQDMLVRVDSELSASPPRQFRLPENPLRRDRPPAVAVLPFEDSSGEQAYFADGLTDDLVTALSLWRSFPVISRNSTISYKGRAVEARQVARELGARYIVEGRVRMAEGRVRVAVRLIDGETGRHDWAGKYDRELRDIFDLQDELTQRIAAIIAPELERVEGRRIDLKRPSDLAAWDFYLRGMALLAEFTPAGNKAARTMFERAVALDPGYADGHVGLALSHSRDLLLECAADREASIGHAMTAARRAVALDPSSPAAHSVLGTVHIWRGENDLALAAAQLAHELNPYDATILHSLGNKSDLAGDPRGIERMLQAQQLNPLDPDRHSHLCFLSRAYVNARRYDDAVAAARAALQRRPDYPHAHFILAIALAHLGRDEEARSALARCDELQPGFVAGRANWSPYVDAGANRHLQDGLLKVRLN